MRSILCLYLSILPGLILGFYIYNKDKVEKEPVSLLLRSFIGGIVSGLLTIIISIVFDVNGIELTSPYNILLYSFVGVALIEEGMKFLLTYLICYRNKEFNYYYDGIIYSSFVSLGFATLENVLYIYAQPDFITALTRGVLTVPAHVFFAIFMGYYLGNAKHFKKYRKRKDEIENLSMAFLIPLILHGFFDYCLFYGSNMMLFIFIIFELILYISAFKKVKEVSMTDRHI